MTCSDDDKFDGNRWLETGSPVKQQGVNNGRVSEIRDTRKIPADEDSDGRGIADIAKPDRAYVEATEAGAQKSKLRG